ncbi:hypothetical protein C4D21_10905 [Clostridium perfringens]
MGYSDYCCNRYKTSMNYITEVKFDERADGDDIPVSIDSKNPTLMLEVGFDIVNASDIIWLHGVVVLDHEYESDIEDGEEGREEDNANITIVIQKVSSLMKDPKPIYTLEVDLAPLSDDVAIPFSHISTETEILRDVRYRVVVYSDRMNEEDVDIEGPNTLMAIRFTK